LNEYDQRTSSTHDVRTHISLDIQFIETEKYYSKDTGKYIFTFVIRHHSRRA
jgi:hypothetical protein